MQCPYCQASFNHAARFCPQCGAHIGRTCPSCRAVNPVDSKYCSECGVFLLPTPPPAEQNQGARDLTKPRPVLQRGERRHITVLFSDLTDYTNLSERCDPEDVQALLAAIMEKARKIIQSYGGHVERIIGDAILAVFGLPRIHEDDAIRAIKAAQEVHNCARRIHMPGLVSGDRPATMHTGINTGLVVTKYIRPHDGHYGISGDTVNLASRLSDMARPDEIWIGPETYKQAHGYFSFERMPLDRVKGKTGDIPIYAVKEEKPRPVTIKRNLGLRSALIGRKAELVLLHQAISQLQQKQGTVFSVIGEAGTGKSRLLHEFESTYKKAEFQWLTAYAYAHTQAIPYFPLIDLLRRWLKIEDTQTAVQVRARIREGTAAVLGEASEEIPIIENLYGLQNEQTEGMSPEIWQERLTAAITRILTAIARRQPTIICMEDLHWADALSITMVRRIVSVFTQPAVFIGTYRPPFNLFPAYQLQTPTPLFREIRLVELSLSEAQDLVESLLNAGTIPTHLLHLIRERTEGNPFFLEELINALVDNKTLQYENGIWVLAHAFKESDIPSTIHGVIAARLDQLSPKARNVIQEAAVIGRVFLSRLLQRVSAYGEHIDDVLNELELSGLIQPRALHPEKEYMFKHALIQEVCYSNILRNERQQVHERIGKEMEILFADRLNEFYETLAMHFKKGQSRDKAVDYLVRSGGKALRRYALEESQRCFLEAKQIAEMQSPPTPESQELLVDVLNRWAFVYYYRGRFRELQKLFDNYQPVVEALSDNARRGMYWAWKGWIHWHRGDFEAAYQTMRRALQLGETAGASHVIGHACTWMAWAAADTGRLDEAVEIAGKAVALFERGRTNDPYLYFNALAAKGYACWHKGERQATNDIGHRLIDFGHKHTNMRSLVLGHSCRGWSCLITGDIAKATECFDAAVHVSADPWYARFPKLALGYGLTAAGRLEAAAPLLQELIEFSMAHGAEFLGTTARFFQELGRIPSANTTASLHFLESQLDQWRRNAGWLRYIICGYVMARTYAALCQGDSPARVGDKPGWSKRMYPKALQWYKTSIDMAQHKNARLIQALSWLGLGELYLAADDKAQARSAVEKAIAQLTRCEAEAYLQQAYHLQTLL